MKKIHLPEPKVVRRKINQEVKKEAISLGSSDLQANIIASRKIPKNTTVNGIINPSLSHIPDYSLLLDIDKAADKISDAIIGGETIGLLCDFDVDGISSTAVLSKSLVDFFNVHPVKIKYFISNRMTEGYGFSDKVLDRVLNIDKNDIPTLLITADQGSADGDRVKSYIEEMKSRDIDASVIVTDHHEIPSSGGPKSAYAFVNPQQKGDKFPDKTICGCTVALLVMVATRVALINKNYLDDDAPKLSQLLAYSTAATIADCVSMASETNRAIVKYGLHEINQEKIPAWKIMKQAIIKNENQPVLADTIAFGLGPRINACSRTGGDGLNGVRFYLSETDISAQRYLNLLDYNNEERKIIEKKLVDESIIKASDMVLQGKKSLVIFLQNGHHGIHGIVASRIVEKFGRPTICLSPKSTEKEIFSLFSDTSIDNVERIIGKNFEEMKTLRSTIKYPKKNNMEFVITKKENYKELKGKERIEKIQIREYIFDKVTVVKILTEKFGIKIGKKLDNFYSIDNSKYLSIEKKNKKDYLITVHKITTLSGSARSIDGIHTKSGENLFDLHRSLENISKKDKKLFLGFGGHTMAAGMSLNVDKVDTLRELFEIEACNELPDSEVGPRIFFDGEIPYDVIDFNLLDEIQKLEPYGRSFDYPSYSATGFVKSIDIVGANKDTASLVIIINNIEYKAVWFKFSSNPMNGKIIANQRCRFVINIKDNYFRNQRYISLQIIHAVPY